MRQYLRMAFNRLIKCKNCNELVPDAAYCIACGKPLK